jgi:hypothetical protein
MRAKQAFDLITKDYSNQLVNPKYITKKGGKAKFPKKANFDDATWVKLIDLLAYDSVKFTTMKRDIQDIVDKKGIKGAEKHEIDECKRIGRDLDNWCVGNTRFAIERYEMGDGHIYMAAMKGGRGLEENPPYDLTPKVLIGSRYGYTKEVIKTGTFQDFMPPYIITGSAAKSYLLGKRDFLVADKTGVYKDLKLNLRKRKAADTMWTVDSGGKLLTHSIFRIKGQTYRDKVHKKYRDKIAAMGRRYSYPDGPKLWESYNDFISLGEFRRGSSSPLDNRDVTTVNLQLRGFESVNFSLIDTDRVKAGEAMESPNYDYATAYSPDDSKSIIWNLNTSHIPVSKKDVDLSILQAYILVPNKSLEELRQIAKNTGGDPDSIPKPRKGVAIGEDAKIDLGVINHVVLKGGIL